MNETRKNLIMQGVITPTLPAIGYKHLVYTTRDTPNIFYVGELKDFTRARDNGKHPKEYVWCDAELKLIHGIENARYTGDASFLFDVEVLCEINE